jgi:FSR family fosmidomycin resistance protein-like MFS transporter
MTFLRDRRFLAISLGHLTVDVFNSLVPVLLTVLSLSLGLSNAQIGLLVTAYSFGGSLSQPLFGYLADRFGGRWLAVGGVTWLLFFFSLAPLAPGNWALACIVLAALGSGAYHPQGASNAAQASATRAATATAFFFLFGQTGLALGPAAGGALVQVAGLRGLWLPALLGVLVVLLLVRTYGRDTVPAAAHGTATGGRPAALRVGALTLAVFALMIFLRSSVQAGTTTFIPKLFADRGVSPASYGIVLSAFMLGSSLGGVVGGNMGDRLGRRLTVAVSLLLASLPLMLYLRMESLAVVWALVAMAGALHGASHSIIVVIAQSMLPGRQALASGLILGFMFTSGAVGAFLVGVAADRAGLQVALASLAVVSVIAGLLALALPAERRSPATAVVPADAGGSLAP